MTLTLLSLMDDIRCGSCHALKTKEEMTPSRRFKRGYNHHCLDCDKRYFGNSYAKRQAKGKKYEVALIVAEMKRKGEWSPKPCEICGSNERIEGHHDDYDKPREVRWLCRYHHLEHHKLINVKAMKEQPVFR